MFEFTLSSSGVALTTCLGHTFQREKNPEKDNGKDSFLYTSKLQMLCETTQYCRF